jgi:hypothetical protein
MPGNRLLKICELPRKSHGGIAEIRDRYSVGSKATLQMTKSIVSISPVTKRSCENMLSKVVFQ